MNKGLNFFKRWIPSDFRKRRVFYAGISSVASKGVNFLIQIISIPLMLHYLGSTRFGVYSAVIGVLGYISFADLGLGLGLQNKLPIAIAKKDQKSINELIASSFYALLLSALVISSIVFILDLYGFELGSIFNLEDSKLTTEATLAMRLLLYMFAFFLPFAISEKIYNSYQEGYFVNLWITLGKLLGLATLFLVIWLELDMRGILATMFGSDKIFLVVSFAWILINKKKKIDFPKVKNINLAVFKLLFKDGITFFIIQVSFVFLSALDSFLIIRYFGAKSMTDYTLALKIVTFILLPFQIFIAPLLPAYNDAFARNDETWVKNTIASWFKIGVITSIFLSVFFYLSAQFIVSLWVGKIIIGKEMIVVFSFYLPYLLFNAIISSIMLSSKFYKVLLIYYPFAAIITFLSKIIMLNTTKSSVELIVTLTIVIPSVLFFLPSIIKLKKNGLL